MTIDGKASRVRQRRIGRIARGLTGLGLFIAILEVVSRLGLVNPTFLPPFSHIVGVTWGVLWRTDFQQDITVTLGSYALGMVASILIAVPLGTVFALSRPTYRASRAVVEVIRPLPTVALIPLGLLVLGPGVELAVAMVLLSAIWPILYNTMYGVRDVDPMLMDMARTIRISRLGRLFRVILPSAAPLAMTGVRLSSAIALIVVITVELLVGGAQGIGSFIARSRAMGNEIELVYAGLLVAGLLGLAINLILRAVEQRFFGWSARPEAG